MNKHIRKKINVKTILSEYLKQHGYDGLFNAELECGCGCTIDDLFPCEADFSECEPAYKLECPCENEGEHEACEYNDGCMSTRKQKNKTRIKKMNREVRNKINLRSI